MHRWFISSAVGLCLAFAAPLGAGTPARIAGSVIGEGGRSVAGALVQVVRPPSEPPCQGITGADGTFSFACDASGRYSVRASFGDLRPWEIADVDLGPGHELHLNFLLVPASATEPAAALPGGEGNARGFWSQPVPNPVLARWRGTEITLRLLAIAVAGVAFVLGALAMFALGSRFGVQQRRLTPGEVGDMVLNPPMPSVGERVQPVAVVGARGSSVNVAYGADEIAAALAARRYGLVFLALVIAPGLFALFSAALAVAMLVGQELYLLAGMFLVPAGFALTAIVIGVQAYARRKHGSTDEPG